MFFLSLKLRERRWQVEGLFGEAKENHCLRRAKYRGLEKVQIQSYMTAIAQNFKRLVDRVPRFIWWLQGTVAALYRRIVSVWVQDAIVYAFTLQSAPNQKLAFCVEKRWVFQQPGMTG